MKTSILFKVFGNEENEEEKKRVRGYLSKAGNSGNPGKRPIYIRLGNHIFAKKLTREIIDRLRGDYDTIIFYLETDEEVEEYALEKGVIPIKLEEVTI